MTQKNRLKGGLINRNNPRTFEFNGQSMQGFEGDTLASALLANDIRLVGRSFKYHRPRGMLSAGSEEPNALVELRTGNRKSQILELQQRNFMMDLWLILKIAGHP